MESPQICIPKMFSALYSLTIGISCNFYVALLPRVEVPEIKRWYAIFSSQYDSLVPCWNISFHFWNFRPMATEEMEENRRNDTEVDKPPQQLCIDRA